MTAATADLPAARPILITGAARGVGRAMALHLARPGALLLLHYRSSRVAIEDVANEAAACGARAIPLQADLALPAEREALLAEVRTHVRALGVLVNNVGVYEDTGLLETTPEQWQRVLDSTCTAVFHLTQGLLPLLRAGAPARVINLGDSAADRIVARPIATPYHVAKLGVHVLTRSYAKLLAPERITVNQISPGFLANSVGEPPPIPAGRPGAFADLLAALDYLLSPGAAYVTGANLIVAGGWNL
jgi:3-oxoacyl-[acyl-carrier protein] reductase